MVLDYDNVGSVSEKKTVQQRISQDVYQNVAGNQQIALAVRKLR